MVLRMKNVNILGVHWKIWLLGGVMKNQYIGGDCLKMRAWTVCWFKGGFARKRGWCFWGGGWYTNAHYVNLWVCSCRLHKKKSMSTFFSFILLLFFFLIWYFKSRLLHSLFDTSILMYHCVSNNNVHVNWYIQYYYWYTDTFLLLHSS